MLNKTITMGRLTADPELKQTPSNISVTSFTIAVDRDYETNGKRETDFFDVVAWRGTAEFIARNFSKGKLITIVGSLQNRRWEDKNGNKRVTNEIKADTAYFCGDGKKETAQEYAPVESEYVPSFAPYDPGDEDLPFN